MFWEILKNNNSIYLFCVVILNLRLQQWQNTLVEMKQYQLICIG